MHKKYLWSAKVDHFFLNFLSILRIVFNQKGSAQKLQIIKAWSDAFFLNLLKATKLSLICKSRWLLLKFMKYSAQQLQNKRLNNYLWSAKLDQFFLNLFKYSEQKLHSKKTKRFDLINKNGSILFKLIIVFEATASKQKDSKIIFDP